MMCLTKPRLTYNEDVLTDDKGECIICFEELEKGQTIARLQCLCIYHKQYEIWSLESFFTNIHFSVLNFLKAVLMIG